MKPEKLLNNFMGQQKQSEKNRQRDPSKNLNTSFLDEISAVDEEQSNLSVSDTNSEKNETNTNKSDEQRKKSSKKQTKQIKIPFNSYIQIKSNQAVEKNKIKSEPISPNALRRKSL